MMLKLSFLILISAVFPLSSAFSDSSQTEILKNKVEDLEKKVKLLKAPKTPRGILKAKSEEELDLKLRCEAPDKKYFMEEKFRSPGELVIDQPGQYAVCSIQLLDTPFKMKAPELEYYYQDVVADDYLVPQLLRSIDLEARLMASTTFSPAK